MAFAYVRFVEDGIKRVVKASDIKKFNPDDINYQKKYKVLFADDKQYYRANIICVGDTENGVVHEAESKRIRLPPSRFSEMLDSVTETEGEEESQLTNNATITTNAIKKKTAEAHNARENANKSFNTLIEEIYYNDLPNNENEDLFKALKQENLKLKKDVKALTERNQELTALNSKLQNDILSNWGDMMITLKSISNCSSKAETNETEVIKPVGCSMDGKIHLGRNVWLPDQIYNSVDVRSKSNGAFVRSLACAVFGSHVLATSSVTGQQCNRTKAAPDPALDATKLLAIHDIVKFRMVSNGASNEEARSFAKDKIDSIIASKISDLKRLPKIYKKKNEVNNENINLEAEVLLAQEALEL